MLRGFDFPDNLPEQLERIKTFQGLEARMDHTFQSSMEYLVSLITGGTEPPIDITFDMRQVRTFASCGNESTVFKVKKSEDGQTVSLAVNFEKTRLRDEIPKFAGAYYIKQPAIDISRAKQIVFSARSADESVEVIWLEVKPEGQAWMHESFEICLSSEYQEYCIDLCDFEYPETLKCVHEITFAIKPVSFANEEKLAGNIDISNLYIK